MWLLSLRDLQWRRRRFMIAVLGAALVFALTLVISGVSAGFRQDAARTVAAFGADGWLVPAGVAGPFTSRAPLPAAVAESAARLPGVRRANAVTIFTYTTGGAAPADVNVLGVAPGGVGDVVAVEGRGLSKPGEAVADASLGTALGEVIHLGSSSFEVVGLVHGVTSFAGLPAVFVGLPDAQALGYAGRPLANAVVVEGFPDAVPDGLTVLTNADVRADLLRPLANAAETITFIMALLWLVATMLIGTLVYLSALERARDFAVLKATGVSTRALVGGLVVQALVLSLAAALLASVAALAIAPAFPLRAEIPASAFLLLPLAAGAAGAAASLFALRRTLAVDPALAFGGP